MIIKQVPEKNEPLHPGDKIDIYISTGKAPVVSTDITIPLPYKSGKEGTLKAYLNNVAIDTSGTDVLLTGDDYTITVSGSGTADNFIVKVDGSDIYSCTIDFTQDPVSIKNIKTIEDAFEDSFYNGVSSTIIPSVVGMSVNQAKETLSSKGFYNITVKERNVVNPNDVGKVIEQTPSLSGIDKLRPYSMDTVIILVVGKGFLG